MGIHGFLLSTAILVLSAFLAFASAQATTCTVPVGSALAFSSNSTGGLVFSKALDGASVLFKYESDTTTV
jgi:hypothetical protein